ncbi:hypothetical protein E2C01_089250 [Portunus trituberculatus]|uniref:Uncharacterized protein n=1 Tax=Portunus trituberculatus TaxID=210409 RepID=A0A5B7JLX9_PORTR|nr:hypothetical protein [Portunus trituberculatus]
MMVTAAAAAAARGESGGEAVWCTVPQGAAAIGMPGRRCAALGGLFTRPPNQTQTKIAILQPKPNKDSVSQALCVFEDANPADAIIGRLSHGSCPAALTPPRHAPCRRLHAAQARLILQETSAPHDLE